MSNMVVRTNTMSLNSHRNLKTVGSQQSKASARLSSGYKINSAADDAAGLAISEKMRAQIRGLDQASTNAQDAISLIQTAEGGMQEINNMVQRIRELVVKASNDTNDQTVGGTTQNQGDRQKIQDEITQLVREIDSMSDRVEFNNKTLIDGTFRDGTATNLPPITAGGAAATQTPEQIAADSLAAILISTDYMDLVNALGDSATYSGNGDDELRDFINGIGSLHSDALANPSTLATNTLWASLTDDTAGAILSDLVLTTGAGKIYGDHGGKIDNIVAELSNIFAALQGGITFDDITSPRTGDATLMGTHAQDLANQTEWAALYAGGTTAIQNAMDALLASHTTKAGLEGNFDAFITALENLASDAANATESGLAQDLLDELRDNTSTAYRMLGQLMADKVAAIDANDAGGGGGGTSLYFQIGANAGQGFTLGINSVKSNALGLGNGNGVSEIDVVRASGTAINGYLNGLDQALTYVTTERSKLGAAQNRLEYTMRSLDISSENLSASESRIRDTDMAKEMMNLTQANVLQQAATSMLAQANMAPQSVLQLLQ